MTRWMKAFVAAVTMSGAVSVAMAAEKVPDLKGTWTGKSFSIVAGSGGHWPNNKGTYDKPGLFEADIRMVVNGQEGRRFWGVWTVTFDGKPTDEPFLGELHGPHNRAIAMTDTDGYYSGEVRGKMMSFCYTQAGVQQTAVVSCTDVHRTR